MTNSVYKTVLLAGVALSFTTAEKASTAAALETAAESRAAKGSEQPSAPRLQFAQAQVAEFNVSDASGDGTQPIPLAIALGKGEQTDYTFVMIRGLPPGFKLSAGFQTKDAWAVSLRDLKGLSLMPPGNFQGNVRLEVLLIKGRDTAPVSQNMIVSVQRQSVRDELEVAAPRPTAQVAAPRPTALDVLLKDDIEEEKTGLVSPPSGVPEAEETALMQRASSLLRNSDVSAARLLFENLAMRGSNKAAFAMGQTYDPNYLKTLFVKGLKADVETARKWYKKAAELGSSDAEKQLAAIDASR